MRAKLDTAQGRVGGGGGGGVVGSNGMAFQFGWGHAVPTKVCSRAAGWVC